jgi:hypothetical protein
MNGTWLFSQFWSFQSELSAFSSTQSSAMFIVVVVVVSRRLVTCEFFPTTYCISQMKGT